MAVGLMVPTVAVAGNNIVVTLKGTGTLIPAGEEPPGYEGQFCYFADLYNTKTGRVIGGGIDCLANPTPFPPGPADTVSLDRTTLFYFRQGTVVAEGRTTVAPMPEAGLPGVSPGFTHIVGDISEFDNANAGNIKEDEGTRRFRCKEGTVRLSGAVNMEAFPGELGFNCIFVIDLDPGSACDDDSDG